MKKLFKWLDVNFEPLVVMLLFFLMFGLVTFQVIVRFFFKSGLSWGEEAARYLFVWLVFSGLSYAVRNNKHISTSFFRNMLDSRLQKFVMIVVDLLFLLFLVFVFKASLDIIKTTTKFGDRGLTVPISMNLVYASAFFGSSLMLIRGVQTLVWKVKRIRHSLLVFSNEGGGQSETDEIFFKPQSFRTDPHKSTDEETELWD